MTLATHADVFVYIADEYAVTDGGEDGACADLKCFRLTRRRAVGSGIVAAPLRAHGGCGQALLVASFLRYGVTVVVTRVVFI